MLSLTGRCRMVAEGKSNELHTLLRAGANPDCTDYTDNTPLHIAALQVGAVEPCAR